MRYGVSFLWNGKNVDSTEFTLTLEPRQGNQRKPLNPEDRRLLLGASLRLLGHRFVCGKPIFKDDVIRVAALADEGTCVKTNR